MNPYNFGPTLMEALEDPNLLVGTVWRSKPGISPERRMVVIAVGRHEYGEQKMLTRTIPTKRLSTTVLSRIFSAYVYEGKAKNV